MAVLVINADPTLPFYTQRTSLDGREYILDIQFNQRENRYYMNLRDETGALIAGGLKLIANFPINRLISDPRAPGGAIYALDTSGRGQDPGEGDLGRRVLLIYIESDDIQASLEG